MRRRFKPTQRYLIERDRINHENNEAQKKVGAMSAANQPLQRWWHLVLGRFREDCVEKALRILRRRREIAGYVRTTHGDVADVIYGVDFYVVCVTPTSREIRKFQVTGPAYAANHRHHHPDVPVIEVTGEESIASIVERIRAHLQTTKT